MVYFFQRFQCFEHFGSFIIDMVNDFNLTIFHGFDILG